MVRHPLRRRGQGALRAVAPHAEVQAVLSHARASVGVLFGNRGMEQPQAGVPRSGGVEQVSQSVA